MKTKSDYAISILWDKRFKKQSGKFPVKLRVYSNEVRKLYPIILDNETAPLELTEKEFESIWQTTKPRNEHKAARLKLQAIEANANEAAQKLNPFTFEGFEGLLFGGNRAKSSDVCFHYKKAIEQYEKNNQIGTASNYDLSLKSLLAFHKKETLPFKTITPHWLKDYEKFMIIDKKRSPTTIGIYVRPLRAIFNTAIAENLVNPESYPFGKRKFVVPTSKGTKKALSKEQLKKLFECEPKTPEQEKAKAFWFFSYSCNGMNFKDIADLQYKNLSGNTLNFHRAKTAKTSQNQAAVKVYLNTFTEKVIEMYGNPKLGGDTFIFPIIDRNKTLQEQHQQKQNFIRFVNQNFLKFAEIAGIDEKISTYWARHSFATNAIRNGASMEFVSEALSHSNLKTTKGYFAGFEDDKKREIAAKLMEF